MNYLVIDTTKKTAHILANINGIDYKHSLGENEKHSENLLPSIDYMMQQANVTIEDIDCFGIVTGPGSFTGIRVGLATLKAFCFGKKKKVVAFSHFDLVKDIIQSGTMLLSSTRTTFYMGNIEKGKVTSAKVIEKEKCIPPYFAYFDEVESMPSDVNIIEDYERLVRAYMVKSITENHFVDIASVEPYYLQLSQAEREWEEKNHD